MDYFLTTSTLYCIKFIIRSTIDGSFLSCSTLRWAVRRIDFEENKIRACSPSYKTHVRILDGWAFVECSGHGVTTRIHDYIVFTSQENTDTYNNDEYNYYCYTHHTPSRVRYARQRRTILLLARCHMLSVSLRVLYDSECIVRIF